MHCLPFSKGLVSCDEDGHLALTSALFPGAERVLKKLIDSSPISELALLAEAQKDAKLKNWSEAASILEEHANRLGYTLDEGGDERDNESTI